MRSISLYFKEIKVLFDSNIEKKLLNLCVNDMKLEKNEIKY